MTTPTNNDPKAIQAHFAKYPGDKYVDGWASLWDKGDHLPWDRGFPNPALEDILVQQAAAGTTIGGPIIAHEDGERLGRRRRKVLVPGCGRGVDVLLFASFGYDAYGLECSAAAVEACKKEEEKEKENDSWYRVRDKKCGKGKVTFVQGDFFDDDTWLEEIGVPRNGFDVIYDYTVCTPYSVYTLRPARTFLLTTIPVFLCSEPRAPSQMGSPTHRAARFLAYRQSDLSGISSS